MNIQKNKQIIITGATGFIGQHLIPLLIEKKYDIIAIARDKNKSKKFSWHPKVNFIYLDFHKDPINIPVKKGASLIHLAWQGLPNYNSLFHFEENLPKSYDFIKSLIQSGVEHVLVTGTCLEYGLQYGPINPQALIKPETPYGIAKDTLRKYLICLKKDHQFELKWTRLFYMFGEGQNSKSILGQLDIAIENGEETFNMSDGEQLRDYLSIEKVAKNIIDIFENKPEGVFNVCSEKPISIRRLVEEKIKEKKSLIQPNLGFYPYPDYEPMAFWGKK